MIDNNEKYTALNIKKDWKLHNERIMKELEHRIISLERISKLLEIISPSTIIVLFLLLATKIAFNGPLSVFNFRFLLIPAFTCIICVTLSINLNLTLKDLGDTMSKCVEVKNNQGKDIYEDFSCGLGSLLSYFCLNTVAIAVAIYLLLLSLKLDNVISWQYNLIGIPVYIALGAVAFYYLFILPAFLQNNFHLEMLLLFTYLICTFLFFLFLNLNLDMSNVGKEKMIHIFLPLLFANGMHITYEFSTWIFSSKGSHTSDKLLTIATEMLFLTANLFTPISIDGDIKFSGSALVLFYLSSFLVYIMKQIMISLDKEKENLN